MQTIMEAQGTSLDLSVPLRASVDPALFSEKEMQMESIWYLYILRCKDGTLYTGITTDVEKRLEAHRSGRGAKYTRGRAPLELVYRETCGSHSDALKREHQIKALSREDKQKLIENQGNPGDCG